MKRYLELIPISARVHKKQSKMTRVCIILAVFLVTAIFSMADMQIRSQYLQAIQTDGNWHVRFDDLSSEEGAMIAARPEVKAASWYDVLNYDAAEDYSIQGEKVVICGFDDDFYQLMPSIKITEGTGIHSADTMPQAVITEGAREKLHLNAGDETVLRLPDGRETKLIICGYTRDTAMTSRDDVIGIFVNMNTFAEMEPEAERGQWGYYVQFSSHCNIVQTISDIQTSFGLTEDQISRNEKLLGIMGMSRDSYILQLYGVAAVLAVLAITAGVLMIASNLNSNIARRTEFFGMMRCLGATRKQTKRFVRLEALNWCKTALPIGCGAGVVITWCLCALLRILSPGYFASMPVLGVSVLGVGSGIVIGIVTVLIAAAAPAKKAAQVSPLTAVSGNSDSVQSVRKGVKTGHLHIETSLGIHHARASRRNFFLMAGSFAFSIVLFLSFTTAVDFLGHALKPLKPYTPDLSIISEENACSIAPETLERVSQIHGVKRAYGRRFAYSLPAEAEGTELKINLISYEENQFHWAKKALTEGNLDEVQNGDAVLTVFDMNNSLHANENLQLTVGDATQSVQIAGVLSECPFSREEGVETIICSESTFQKLIGESGYTILDIQLSGSATDEDVAVIRQLSDAGTEFSDQRLENRDVRGGFYSMALFIYGFLIIIALISSFNIINSIAMSVSARMRQYGAMRAIGMSDRQLIWMIAVEAATYAFYGILSGCIIGLPLHRFLYQCMITSRWGDVWKLPVLAVSVIILTIGTATVLSICGPAKQVREMTIVDSIHGD